MAIDYSKPGGGGVSDHGALTGLADDDHSQYHNVARANTWLATKDSDDVAEGSTNLYANAQDLDTQDNGRLARNSTTQIQLEALAAGTHDFVAVAGERVDINTPETCDTTDNLLAADGTDSGGAAGASTKYYAYLSNSSASYAASSLRLSATSPTGGYLAASGNGANWRHVGTVYTNASTQFDAVGAVRDVETVPIFPEKVMCWHDESKIVIGNAFSRTGSASQVWGGWAYQNPGANGDTFEQDIVLDAGTYSFSVLGVKSVSAAILDWYLEGVKIVNQQDWYAAANTYNAVQTTTGIVISRRGKYRIRGVVNGKNPLASGSYHEYLTKYWFTRTG